MAYDTYYPQNNWHSPYEEDEWPDDEEWVGDEVWYDDEPYPFYEQVAMGGQSVMRPQLLLIPAVVVTMLLLIFLGRGVANTGTDGRAGAGETAVSTGGVSSSFIAPYDDYVLTQGLHGYSYGHMAIDIAAGVGAAIKAPIDGEITELYTDQYSNSTLVIENERYQVTFLHGNYTAVLGQKFKQGDVIGTEGNNGYTMDSAGNLCYGRADCGYHTHLNVFDKQLGQNVNPLDLISK